MNTPKSPAAGKSFKPVEAAIRALEVLRVVNDQREASVASIHRVTGLDKATIIRMLETLTHEGYINRATDRAVYSATGRTLLLSKGYHKARWMADIAAPVLDEFRAQIGWPSDIAVFDHDAMVLIQTTRRNGSLMINRQAGFRAPMLTTSIGLSYLAFCSEEERTAIINTLAASNDPQNNLAKHPNQLHRIISKVQKDGYAVMSSSYSEEMHDNKVNAIGIPIGKGSTIYGSMNILYLTDFLTMKEAISKFLPTLIKASHDICDLLDNQ